MHIKRVDTIKSEKSPFNALSDSGTGDCCENFDEVVISIAFLFSSLLHVI